jgi:DNA-binding SARP family transcriptional activator
MEHAARLLELDPLMEAGHRQMMRLLAGSGQRTAALAQYESCQALLGRSWGSSRSKRRACCTSRSGPGSWR